MIAQEVFASCVRLHRKEIQLSIFLNVAFLSKSTCKCLVIEFGSPAFDLGKIDRNLESKTYNSRIQRFVPLKSRTDIHIHKIG